MTGDRVLKGSKTTRSPLRVATLALLVLAPIGCAAPGADLEDRCAAGDQAACRRLTEMRATPEGQNRPSLPSPASVGVPGPAP